MTYTAWKPTPREDFNGGYWDGRDDRERVRSRRERNGRHLPLPDFAPIYSEGYDAGYAADSETHSSEPAWKRRQQKARDAKAERKRIKAMRPGRSIRV